MSKPLAWSLGLILFAAASPSIHAESPGSARMNLLIWDFAGVRPAVLAKAAEAVTSLFRQAGVEIAWVSCRQADGATKIACQRAFDPADYALRILAGAGGLAKGLEHGGGGIALSGGRNATVFFDRISQQAQDSGLDLALVLACVSAHELGHMLLPPGYHSGDTLMRARLQPEQWRRAAAGGLRFSAHESGLMRAALKRALN